MYKIKDFFQKLLFSLAGSADFILYKEQLYTKKKILVKNDRIRFFKRRSLLPINLVTKNLEGEEFYLLLIHTDNIAHFFHDIFFPFYVEWRKNKKRVCVSIKENSFQREFLESLIPPKDLVFLDYDTAYIFSNLIVTPEGRDLKIYPDYREICREIKAICFARHGISEFRTKNLIYGRNELSRKNLLNIDQAFLKENSIDQVFLSKLSFKDYLHTLASAGTFTYMVGAGVFNLLFLDDNVQVLEINPHRNNSWAQLFGLSELCKFNVIISNNLEHSSAAAQDELILDSHVYFDQQIETAIKALIARHD
ncbi:hypothetical protein A9235_01575 [Polynucleobacter sp. MWH-Tro8-2-5-gr]|jgi:hypothetical protein|uniref:glycosyltransferase 61 family protein n=1 Tax=Polynucleobacter sp. MWH-Tro8-2-5-gr TaxID=1855606 RepID=UPI0008F87101|nr:glycosyltransferase 61 family protein [Polynucleobacter sp. MWH-Tro8-2-5-gr]OIN02408.1 hypothetical protein A9235_01575 [Polynucleobacter sp. MWH-Tro8-2-5-gr]